MEARSSQKLNSFILHRKSDDFSEGALRGWVWVALRGSAWVWEALGMGSGWLWVGLGGSGWVWLGLGGFEEALEGEEPLQTGESFSSNLT